MSVDFSVSALPAIAGAVLSLLFSYVPGLESWYAGQEAVYKRLIMLTLVVGVSVAVYALGCAGLISTTVTCDKAGLMAGINVFFSVLVANQAAFLITAKK